ncbi:hypothetical protein G6F70_004322 [Rhizopus microsporus]|nr:hypothetical protein G6F71_004332 [Rhizopus microsporus]KAG1200105.1 hypothetical protein G6F70_004322 [Rhizopus microsporus]KAG1211775.1 hypothetical protein G6F69_004288 [Rhizopus microsporus]KAG1233755.1 hypothetical protein G6F67_004036 [Rhizopus microsporus]KAG1265780.1 hypothetical protein G6F68_003311 [Rhizopus microsporus]
MKRSIDEAQYSQAVVAEPSDDLAEEETDSIGNDIPGRRLMALRGVIKDILFKRFSHSTEEDEVSNKLVDAESEELQTCVLIINFLKTNVPSKESFYTISHQISFFLMSNGILHATGYSKFTAKITPRLVSSTLNALNAGAPFLFTIFYTRTKLQKTRAITQDALKCIDKVENMKVDNGLLKSSKSTRSDTGNGLVTMTETADLKSWTFK